MLLEPLPLVEDITTALHHLSGQGLSASEAIYYGLVPGMLHAKAQGKPIDGNRGKAIGKYLADFKGNERNEFRNLTTSLVSGSLHSLHKSLHALMDAFYDDGAQAIRWVPFHFEYVMQKIGRRAQDESIRRLASGMAILCGRLRSGDGWKGLFVLLLIARCVANEPDSHFLPKEWFVQSPRVEYNPYQCQNWNDVVKGVRREAHRDPTVSIFYLEHGEFAPYDCLAIYSKDHKIFAIYGYQLKETSSQRVEPSFETSVMVKESPPAFNSSKNQWLLPNAGTISEFFGRSGVNWTPQAWKRLSSTVPQPSKS